MTVLVKAWVLVVLAAFAALAYGAFRVFRFMVRLFLENPVVNLEVVGELALRAPGQVQSIAVDLAARDGTPLAGQIVSRTDPPRGLVIFAPEFGGSQEGWVKHAGSLVDAGFTVATFDFRGTGASPRVDGYKPRKWCSSREVDDLLGVIDRVHALFGRRMERIVLVGVSRGGVASLAAADRVPAVRGVVVEGVASTLAAIEAYLHRWANIWVPRAIVDRMPDAIVRITARMVLLTAELSLCYRFPLIETMGRRPSGELDRRVLFIYGSRDRHVDEALQVRTFGAYRGRKELWTVPGARHNAAAFAAPEEYQGRVVAFVEEVLGLVEPGQERQPSGAPS